MRELNNRQRIIFIVVALFVVLALLGAILALVFGQKNNEIVIGNYDKYIKDLPQERRDVINTALYGVVKTSLPNSNLNINDALIRDGSYTETYNDPENTYSSMIIVDIASIKQSYKIIFIWSKDTNNPLNGDNLRFDCLPKDQLIYGDFKCDEILQIPDVNNSDPILQYLPYSTFNYMATLGSNTGDKIRLDIKIFLYSSDTRDGNGENAINQYKTDAVDWIKSKGLKPENYSINYTVDGL